MSIDSLQNDAYRALQSRILSGRLPQGTRVSELSLVKEIGIGRTPIREAILRLELEGYVERVPRFGTIVREPTEKDIEDLYELRVALESYAASQAATIATPTHIARLKALCDELDAVCQDFTKTGTEMLSSELLQRFRVADLKFHIDLIQITGNQRIVKLVCETQVMTKLFCNMTFDPGISSVASAHHFHGEVTAAIEESNPEKARKIMEEHIRISKTGTLENMHRKRSHRDIQTPDIPGLPLELADELIKVEQRLQEAL